MSLQLDYTDYGHIFNYWKILRVNDYSHKLQKTEVTISVFKDETYKNSGEPPVKSITYIFKKSDYASGQYPFEDSALSVLNKSPRSIAYELIKNMKKSFLDKSLTEPEASQLVWEGALDV